MIRCTPLGTLSLLAALTMAFLPGQADSSDEEVVSRDATVDIAVRPDYPKKALDKGQDGFVTIAFEVSPMGTADDPEVTFSEPRGVFNKAALAALEHWVFQPAKSGCVGVEQKAQQSFEFRFDAGVGRVSIPVTVIGPRRGAEALYTVESEVEIDTAKAILVEARKRVRVKRAANDEPLPYGEVTPVETVEPLWPKNALIEGREGFVTLSFDVTQDGSVENVDIIESQPKRLFVRSARQAIEQWRFKPRVVDGQPVRQHACQTIRYTLAADLADTRD